MAKTLILHDTSPLIDIVYPSPGYVLQDKIKGNRFGKQSVQKLEKVLKINTQFDLVINVCAGQGTYEETGGLFSNPSPNPNVLRTVKM